MLGILGMGYAHPEADLDNKFIESLDIGTNEEWIVSKIGIESRKTTLPLEYIAETRNQDPAKAEEVATGTSLTLGVDAIKMALDRAGVSIDQVGMLVCNCCTPGETLNSEAQRLAAELEWSGPAFDVFTACPIFALHLNFLENFEEDALPEYIVCVSTATLTQRVNYNDRSDSAIWGDGAAAWVVSSKHAGKLQIKETSFSADPVRCDAVIVDSHGHFHQDGRAVRDFSVRQTVRMMRQIEREHDIDWTKDIFIGHQANRTMLDQITRNRKVPDSNHWHNVTHIGNQAGAGAPATLAMHWDQIQPGQKIVVAVLGAGLSWGSALLEAQ